MSSPRRDRIGRMARARAALGDTPAGRGEVPIWVTRDTIGGRLSVEVNVWLARPDRIRYEDGTTVWYALPHYARWSLVECEAVMGTIPDDDRQCLARGIA